MEAADPSSRPAPGLKRTSLLLLALLTALSLGPYYPIWFLRRRRGLNLLDSSLKVKRWPFILAIVFISAQLLFTAGAESPSDVASPGEQGVIPLFFGLGQIAIAILLLYQHFLVKGILEDHLASLSRDSIAPGISDESAKLSGAFTMFFGIFYLQHVINTRVIGAATEPPSPTPQPAGA